MRRALLPLLLLSSLGVVGFRSPALLEETYSLVHKHTVGEVQSVVMKIEGKFGETNFVSTVDLTQKVTEVAEDGGYTVELTTGDTKTLVNGEETPSEPSDEPKTKIQRYDAKGKKIVDDGEADADGPLGNAFEYEPKTPVKIGDTWTGGKDDEDDDSEPLEWTLTGKEQYAGKEVLVVEGKGKGPNGASIESKVWLDPATFIARKATATVRGIQEEGAPEGEMTISIEEKA